jgi:hypothetical protein
MTPEEQRVVLRARRRVARGKYAIPFFVAWVIALGLGLRLANSKKVSEQPLIEQHAARERVKTYMMYSAAIFLSGIAFAPTLFASPAERLLVRIMDEQER